MGYKKKHECIDCGKLFEAHSSRAVRCQDCRKRHKAEYQKSYVEAHPEVAAYNREYLRKYNQRPDVRAKRKTITSTEAYKEKAREAKRRARATEEGRSAARMAALKYESSEKGKAKRMAYNGSEGGKQRDLRGRNKRRARLYGAVSDGWTRKEIFDRDCGVCQICGLPVYDYNEGPRRLRPEFDHIIPLSRGGQNTANNIQLTHAYCNHHKNAGEADKQFCRKIIGKELEALADSLL